MGQKGKSDFRCIYLILIIGLYVTTAFPTQLQSENQGCDQDFHCSEGFFCYTKTQTCIPCGEVDCSKYGRLPGITKCPKSKQECGPCTDGYILKFGSCIADEFTGRNLDPHLDILNGTGGFFSSAGIKFTSYVIVTLIITICSILALAVCYLRRKKHTSFEWNPTKDAASAPLTGSTDFELYQIPPPYNVGANINQLDNEAHSRALPFQDGNFSSSVDQTFSTLNDGNGDLPETFSNPFAPGNESQNDLTVPDIANDVNPEQLEIVANEDLVPVVPQIEPNPQQLHNNSNDVLLLVGFNLELAAYFAIGGNPPPPTPQAQDENEGDNEDEDEPNLPARAA